MGDSQDESKAEEICLKCRKPISHVPYKYDNHTFHARCLLCSSCGRRLVGKPFVTEGQNIFCGEQCQTEFEDVPTVDLNSSVGSELSEQGVVMVTQGQMNESLMEALESIHESKQEALTLTKKDSPLLQPPDMDRLTDYPVASSPDSFLSHSPAVGSRRSSLSAVSESSLTSDGSYSYDANRRPGKRILKHPQRPRRRSTNRVRWKDSDTTSQDSFETNESIQEMQNGIDEIRQNWQEFEQPPPKGSTGLTPLKHIPPSPSSSPMHLVGGGSLKVPRISFNNVDHHRFQRSPSPLLQSPPAASPRQSPPSSPSPTSPSPDASSPSPSPSPVFISSPLHQPGVLHSTPFQRALSPVDTTAALRQYYASRVGRTANHGRSHSADESSTAVLDVSVFKFDESHLSDLENSTPGIREKRHMYMFPKSEQKSLLFDSDADDYDHLRPRESTPVSESNTSRQSSLPGISPLMENGHRAKSSGKPYPSHDQMTDDDIDEALGELEQGIGRNRAPVKNSTENGVRSTRTLSQGEPNMPHMMNGDLHLSPSPPPVPQRTESSLRDAIPGDLPGHQGRLPEGGARRKDLPPPPVPPRLRQLSSPGHPKGKYKPLPPLPEAEEKSTPPRERSHVTASPGSQNSSQNSDFSDVVLDPPPEFAARPHRDKPRSSSSCSEAPSTSMEDGLTSISSTTLIAEQDDSSHVDTDPYSIRFSSSAAQKVESKRRAVLLNPPRPSLHPRAPADDEKHADGTAMVEKRAIHVPNSGSDSSLDEHGMRTQSAVVQTLTSTTTSPSYSHTGTWPRPSSRYKPPITRLHSPQSLTARPLSPQPTATRPLSPQPTATRPLSPQPAATRPLSPQPTATRPLSPQPAATRPLSAPPTATRPLSPQPATLPRSTRPLSPQPTATRPLSPQPTTRPQPRATRPLSPQPTATRPLSPQPTTLPRSTRPLSPQLTTTSWSTRPLSPQPMTKSQPQVTRPRSPQPMAATRPLSPQPIIRPRPQAARPLSPQPMTVSQSTRPLSPQPSRMPHPPATRPLSPQPTNQLPQFSVPLPLTTRPQSATRPQNPQPITTQVGSLGYQQRQLQSRPPPRDPTARPLNSQSYTNPPMSVAPRRYKHSIDIAFSEGNLLIRDNYPTKFTGKPRPPEGQDPTAAARPPNSVRQRLSPEDQYVYKAFYSGGKLPSMKPVTYDTEQTIDQMLAELETETSTSGEERERESHCGTCVACGKSIRSVKGMVTFERHHYHCKCFSCTICGCQLSSKNACPVQNKLLCREDFFKFDAQSTKFRRPEQQVSYRPPQHQGMHIPMAGGRVTSV